jgi:hypothetical protein
MELELKLVTKQIQNTTCSPILRTVQQDHKHNVDGSRRCPFQVVTSLQSAQTTAAV